MLWSFSRPSAWAFPGPGIGGLHPLAPVPAILQPRFSSHLRKNAAAASPALLPPSGTFTPSLGGTSSIEALGVRLSVENLSNPGPLLQKMQPATEAEAVKSYRRWSSPPALARPETDPVFVRLPSFVPNGTLTLSTDDSGRNTGLVITQNKAGDTVVEISDKDSGQTRTFTVGRVARLVVRTGAGDDTVSVSAGNYAGGVDIRTGAGNDTLSLRLDRVFGPGLTVDAGAGDDTVSATARNTNVFVSGGEGDDTLDFSKTSLASWFHLAAYGGAGNDRLVGSLGNDILAGGEGDDTLLGRAGGDRLFGGADNDTLSGGEGDDRLDGGTGTDVLRGAAGADVFVSRPGSRVVDYNLPPDGDTMA